MHLFATIPWILSLALTLYRFLFNQLFCCGYEYCYNRLSVTWPCKYINYALSKMLWRILDVVVWTNLRKYIQYINYKLTEFVAKAIIRDWWFWFFRNTTQDMINDRNITSYVIIEFDFSIISEIRFKPCSLISSN